MQITTNGNQSVDRRVARSHPVRTADRGRRDINLVAVRRLTEEPERSGRVDRVLARERRPRIRCAVLTKPRQRYFASALLRFGWQQSLPAIVTVAAHLSLSNLSPSHCLLLFTDI